MVAWTRPATAVPLPSSQPLHGSPGKGLPVARVWVQARSAGSLQARPPVSATPSAVWSIAWASSPSTRSSQSAATGVSEPGRT
ncbi:hypothetical protein [Nannocystis pusilla]|uniref:hypothetical protein n=1 Tax=Nannocystis pusilla TaxID=889268 RepID=UPI003B78AA01